MKSDRERMREYLLSVYQRYNLSIVWQNDRSVSIYKDPSDRYLAVMYTFNEDGSIFTRAVYTPKYTTSL